MNNSNIPKLFLTSMYVAFVYSICLIIFSIYFQFFFNDNTLFHNLISNGFTVLSGIVWIVILLIFKKFLNIIYEYKKSDNLINIYVFFLAMQTILFVIVVIKIIKSYIILKNGGEPNSVINIAYDSLSSVFLLFITNYAIILMTFLLGFRFRKLDYNEKKLFEILGYSLIAYSIANFLSSLSLIETNFFTFFFKAISVFTIGLILQKISNLKSSELNTLFEHKKLNETKNIYFKRGFINNEVQTKQEMNLKTKQNSLNKEFSCEKYYQHEHKDLVIKHFESLSEEELDVLKNKISLEGKQTITEDEKTTFILQYIFENKLYDYLRFMPKK